MEIIHGIPIDETIIKNLLEYRSTIYPENNDLVAKADIHGFVNLILHPDLKDEILYSELKVNKNTVAKSLCFINNNQLFYYIPIFDREYFFSPGKILLEDLYSFCEQQEISIINFQVLKNIRAWADEFNLLTHLQRYLREILAQNVSDCLIMLGKFTDIFLNSLVVRVQRIFWDNNSLIFYRMESISERSPDTQRLGVIGI